MNKELRAGRFTSSQASRVMASLKSGLPSSAFFTYVKEKAAERSMGITLGTEVKVRSILWGRLMEVVLFDLLGIEYKMEHKKTLVHPKYPFWSGTPDLEHAEKVGEIKCYERKKFGLLSMCLNKQNIAELKNNFKEEYWQCVSNAALIGVKKAELIAYMPYLSELKELLDLVKDTNFLEKHGLPPEDYYWFTEENLDTMPYLPDDSPMSNVNSFEFEVPELDFVALEQRMIMADEEVLKLI